MILVKNLIKVRSILEDQNRWTKGKLKEVCDDNNKYCIFGACLEILEVGNLEEYEEIINYLCEQIKIFPLSKKCCGVAHFNDTCTHNELLQFLDFCIIRAKNKIVLTAGV